MTLTVDEALDRYYREHLAKTAMNRKSPEDAMHYLRQFFKGNVSDIGIPECRAYADWRRQGVAKTPKGRPSVPASEAAIARDLGVLKAAVNHAWKWKHMPQSHVPYIELPKTPPTKGAWLYKDELNKLLKKSAEDTRVFGFIMLSYFTAARYDAVLNLKWDQVDFETNIIDFNEEGRPLTTKRRAVVPICKEIKNILKVLYKTKESEFVLYNNASIRTGFDYFADEAGVLNLPRRGLRPKIKLTPHMLRHSRATHLLQEGKNLFTVAGLLGDNPATVARVYAHHCTENLEEKLG